MSKFLRDYTRIRVSEQSFSSICHLNRTTCQRVPDVRSIVDHQINFVKKDKQVVFVSNVGNSFVHEIESNELITALLFLDQLPTQLYNLSLFLSDLITQSSTWVKPAPPYPDPNPLSYITSTQCIFHLGQLD